MLPIPKELQGTKAIPFMEWYICYYSNYGGTMDVITDFYSQPFTPEMLQEYFEEEWIQKPEDIDYELIINKETKAYIYLDFYPNYCIYTFGDAGDNMFIFESLNDFTTLCNLAGINLKWKGETE